MTVSQGRRLLITRGIHHARSTLPVQGHFYWVPVVAAYSDKFPVGHRYFRLSGGLTGFRLRMHCGVSFAILYAAFQIYMKEGEPIADRAYKTLLRDVAQVATGTEPTLRAYKIHKNDVPGHSLLMNCYSLKV